MTSGISQAYNIFSIVHAGNTHSVMSGSGGYTWDEVHEYHLRRLERDAWRFSDKAHLMETINSWENRGPSQFLMSTAALTWMPCYSFGAYAYDPDGDLDEPLRRHLDDIYPPEPHPGRGSGAQWRIQFCNDMREEVTVSRSVTDMRIDLLHERIGLSRTAPALSADIPLLEWDDALEANWNSMWTLASTPGIEEESRREAEHLGARLSLLRADLTEQAIERGLPLTPDPDITAN